MINECNQGFYVLAGFVMGCFIGWIVGLFTKELMLKKIKGGEK